MIDLLPRLALAVFVYMTLLFLLAQLVRDNSIVDVGWGGIFVLLALLSFPWASGWPARPTLVTVLVVVWALRLAFHIGWRKRGQGEDFRYAAWRRAWGRTFLVRSFFQVFMLQGFFGLVVALGVIAVNIAPPEPLGILDGLGTLVWLTGFFFQAVGDLQLSRFKRDPANRGRLMDHGLWRWTRHPNYFGEALMWWGIALLALSVAGGWVGLVSAAVITGLVRWVSGVPMLEEALRQRPGWEAYARRTPVFFPRPPRSRGADPDL
jgi:steroid 5-alpha reductase family enzyme